MICVLCHMVQIINVVGSLTVLSLFIVSYMYKLILFQILLLDATHIMTKGKVVSM